MTITLEAPSECSSGRECHGNSNGAVLQPGLPIEIMGPMKAYHFGPSTQTSPCQCVFEQVSFDLVLETAIQNKVSPKQSLKSHSIRQGGPNQFPNNIGTELLCFISDTFHVECREECSS